MSTNGTPVPPPPPVEAPPSPLPPAVPAAAPKADLSKRFLAALIDGLLMGVVGMIPFIGAIVSACYEGVRDGLEIDFMNKRSIGKKVMKLRPVRIDGQPMDLATSIKRNIPLLIGWCGAIIFWIPILGWILGPFIIAVGAIIAIVECILVLTDAEGRRWGDKLAGTKVIEVAD